MAKSVSRSGKEYNVRILAIFPSLNHSMTKSVDPENNILLSSLLKCFKHRSHFVIHLFETIKNMCEFCKKESYIAIKIQIGKADDLTHRLRTHGEKITFTARLKINSQSQIFRYGRSIFCLLYLPKFSDFFDLCLHWVSVVRGQSQLLPHKNV